MAFGFDPSLILATQQPQAVTSFGDMLQRTQQMKLMQAQEGRAQSQFDYNMGRARSLADVYRQSAGNPSALPGALMSGGFGQEAMAAQDQMAQAAQRSAESQKMLSDLMERGRNHIVQLMQGVKDQADYEKRLSTQPQQFAQMFPQNWEDAKPIVDSLSMSPKDRADVQNKQAQLDIDKTKAATEAAKLREVGVNSVTGQEYQKYPQGGPGNSGAGAAEMPPEARGLKPKDINEEFDKLSDAVSTVKSRGNLNADRQKRLDAAERLEKLILNGKQIQNLTPQQVREASTSLANLISSGAMSEHQIEELTPDTLAGKWAALKQKVLNSPQGADAQKFLQNMLETAGRETAVTRNQIRAGQEQALPNRAWLRKVNPSRYEAILQGAGLNPRAYNDQGRPNVVKSDSDYEALPSGAAYLAPDGKLRVKQ